MRAPTGWSVGGFLSFLFLKRREAVYLASLNASYYSVFLWEALTISVHVHKPQVARSPELIHLWSVLTSLLFFPYVHLLPVSAGGTERHWG